jgi:hypothetical protein
VFFTPLFFRRREMANANPDDDDVVVVEPGTYE